MKIKKYRDFTVAWIMVKTISPWKTMRLVNECSRYLFASSANTGLLDASYFLHSVLAFLALFPGGLLFLIETVLRTQRQTHFNLQTVKEHGKPRDCERLLKRPVRVRAINGLYFVVSFSFYFILTFYF